MTASAAWLPDPAGRHQYRWWDGAQWTQHVADNGQVAIDPTPIGSTPEMPPILGEAELVDAARLIDQFDTSLGNSDAVWTSVEAIARRGGFRGDDTLHEMFDSNKDPKDILDRPWRWWAEAARASSARGDHLLTGRIFLFSVLFSQQMAPKMTVGDSSTVGLIDPGEERLRELAALAKESFQRIPPATIVHSSATGTVDAGSAVRIADSFLPNPS